jgi:mRNA-degrading endonuclease YafQ of YafQ-DinJ toxin-antitoxin module
MAKPKKSSSGQEKNEPKEKPAPAPSSCEVQTSTAFRKAVRKLGLSEAEKSDLESRIREVGKQFGKPHRHAGLGIRDLGAGFYECRSGLDLRLVFIKDASTSPPTLYFDMIGNHDQVRRYLKRK